MKNRKSLLSTVRKKIRDIDPEARIILFGSRARGDSNPNSDWDFLILTRKEVNQDLKNKISDSLFEAELETDYVMTGIVQNLDFWNNISDTPIFKNISRDGIEP